MLQEKEKQVEIAYNTLKPYAVRLIKKKLNQTTVGEMLSYLNFLKSRVNALEVKKTDASSHRLIISNIQTKIDELTILK